MYPIGNVEYVDDIFTYVGNIPNTHRYTKSNVKWVTKTSPSSDAFVSAVILEGVVM